MDPKNIKIHSSQPYLLLPQVRVSDMGTSALLVNGPLQVLQLTVTTAQNTLPTVTVPLSRGMIRAYLTLLVCFSVG